MPVSVVAIHEAGHAVAVLALGEELESAEVRSDGGTVRWAKPNLERVPEALNDAWRERLARALIVALAGDVAVRMAFPQRAADALERLGDILDEDRYLELIEPQATPERRGVLREAFVRRAAALLRTHERATFAIAEALHGGRQLDASTLQALFKAHRVSACLDTEGSE